MANQGAGVLPIAQNTGRMLLGLRSAKVHGPGEWAIFGGHMEAGHRSSAHCALDELGQETGYRGKITLIEAPAYRTPDFTFHNFIGIIPYEFVPKLNWEHDDSMWCVPNELPRPLHEGVLELIRHSQRVVR